MYLLDEVPVFVGDDVGRAKLTGELRAVGSGPYADDARRARQSRPCDCHQADWANAEDDDVVAKLDLGIFHAMKACRHHVSSHQSILKANIVGLEHKVSVCVVHVVALCKHAVFLKAELEALHHAVVMCVVDIAILQHWRFPIRGAAIYHAYVSGLEPLDV